MPLYEYTCHVCGNRFEKLRPMSSSEEDAKCPDCGSRAPRALSVFASIGGGGREGVEAMVGGGGYGAGNYACTPGLE